MIHPPGGGHLKLDPGPGLIGAHNAAFRYLFEHAVHVNRKAHLHGVGFFIGQRQHAHHRLTFLDDANAPVHPLFTVGFNRDGADLLLAVDQCQAAAV